MAREFSGTGQYLSLASSLGRTANGAFWVSGWFWIDTNVSTILFSLGVGSSGNNRRHLTINTGVGGFVAQSVDNAGGTANTAAATVTTGVWTHLLAEFGGTTSRAITKNGGTRLTNATTATLTAAPDQARIAASHTASGPLDGRSAYVAVFSGAPAAQDFIDLSGSGTIAAAKHPTLTTSAANLIAYWDLDGTDSPEPDGVGVLDMVLTGSPTQVASPGIILPGGGALTSGTASGSVTGSTTTSLSVDAATGGTSPYTYQWYRDTTPGFTPSGSNDIVGATSTSLSDSGLTPSTAYYYKCVATDNVAATVTSNEVNLTTTAAAGSVPRNRVMVVL